MKWLTWDVLTNAAYVLAGAIAIGLVPGPMGFAFGLAMIALGLASALFHSGAVKWGNHADVLAMYVVGTILLVSAFGVSGAIGAVAALLGGLGLGFWLRGRVDEPMERKVGALFLGVLVATSIRSVYLAADWRLISLGTLLLLVALWVRFGWSVLDDSDLLGLDRVLIPHPKAHGAWHVLSAPGLLAWFLGTP